MVKRVVIWNKGEGETDLMTKLDDKVDLASIINNTGTFSAQHDFKITIEIRKEIIRKKKTGGV